MKLPLALGLAAVVAASMPAARADRAGYFLAKLESAGFKVRLQAAFILGTLRDRRAVPGLSKALGDPHYAVRAAAALSLGRIGEPLAADALALALQDSEPWVRSEAVKSLGLLAVKKSVPRVVSALGDSDWKVRLEAARALGRMGDPQGVDPLARIIEEGLAGDDVVDAARRSLSQLGALVDIEATIKRLASGTDKRLRARSAVILGVLKQSRAVPKLIACLSDPESYVRGNCALALANIGDRRALDPLQALLGRESDKRVKSIAKLSVSLLKRSLKKR